ncbi:MAG: Thioesterase superfamily [Bryobacterales bacterium]|nr:Thioesterase superfamily [Bryobacterales bacterium]
MIEIGAVREETITVEDRVAINFMGLENARVLATPQMIQHMEITSRNLLFPMLEPGFDSVGTVVNVKHLGAAPIGTQVTFRSEIASVDGRRVTFHVEARDGLEKIGEGTHERFVVHIERFAEKMRLRLARENRVV